MAEVQERPHKKRRFFVDDSPEPEPTFAAEPPTQPEPSRPEDEAALSAVQEDGDDVFDAEMFKAVVGEEVPQRAVISLQNRYGSNLEGAINAYFDGS